MEYKSLHAVCAEILETEMPKSRLRVEAYMTEKKIMSKIYIFIGFGLCLTLIACNQKDYQVDNDEKPILTIENTVPQREDKRISLSCLRFNIKCI
jgi:hypothetical protein